MINTRAAVKNCVERNAHILGPHYAGGLSGALSGNNAAIQISDMEFSDVMVMNRNDNGSGLLVGNANTDSKATKFAIKGYNILAKNCRSGCNKTVTVNQMSADTKLEQYSKTGLWVGDGKENLTGTGMIQLVAVSAEGEVSRRRISEKETILPLLFMQMPEQKTRISRRLLRQARGWM